MLFLSKHFPTNLLELSNTNSLFFLLLSILLRRHATMVMTTYTSSHRSSPSRDGSREGKLTPRGQLAPRVSLTSCSRAFPGHRWTIVGASFVGSGKRSRRNVSRLIGHIQFRLREIYEAKARKMPFWIIRPISIIVYQDSFARSKPWWIVSSRRTRERERDLVGWKKDPHANLVSWVLEKWSRFRETRRWKFCE